MSARMRLASVRYSSPSGVRLMRRVVRLSNCTPSRASSSARRRLTAGGVNPSSRAAADRLPQRIRTWKKAISPEALAIAIIVKSS